jgi:hypothetical protein
MAVVLTSMSHVGKKLREATIFGFTSVVQIAKWLLHGFSLEAVFFVRGLAGLLRSQWRSTWKSPAKEPQNVWQNGCGCSFSVFFMSHVGKKPREVIIFGFTSVVQIAK